MALNLRRVITGHHPNGKARVLIDEPVKNVISGRPGAESTVVWTTEGFPVDNDGSDDTSGRKVGTTLGGGIVFRVVEFSPGVAARNHRTDSIDFAVVMSGEIDMQLDDEEVHLKAGDVLVQRGTIHNWVNNSKEPCLVAFILIWAKPVEINGKRFDAHG
jgi:quercetin dioxygenase-like cupin family protein